MAANPIPDRIDDLFTLAEDMADGLNTHEVAIDIKQNTEATVRAALTSAQNAQADFDTAQGAKPALSTAVTVADSNGKAYLGTARNVLTPSLGTQWSAAWEPTGFPDQSLAIPGTQAKRQALLGSLQTYFTANPAKENAPLNVTAAQADTLFTALSNARSGSNQGLTNCGQKKAVRQTQVNTLKKRMRGLIGELEELLEDDDPRWLAFGLNMPGAASTPEAPEGLVLTAGPAGTLNADWADTPRADRYHVFLQIVGTDADFNLVRTVTDSDAALTGLPSGATVRVQVTAVNAAGESVPSTVQEAVVP